MKLLSRRVELSFFSRGVLWRDNLVGREELEEVDETLLAQILAWLARHYLCIGQKWAHQGELRYPLHLCLLLLPLLFCRAIWCRSGRNLLGVLFDHFDLMLL